MKYKSWLILFMMGTLSTLWAAKLDTSRKQVDLTGGWQFREAGKTEWLDASVPGCVHTDLMAHNRIPDPFFGTHEKDLQWIGEREWEYRKAFTVDADLLKRDAVEIVFDGLDTYAEVVLNGVRILTADNSFRTWRVDVKPVLQAGENRMQIRFRSVFDVNVPKWETAPFRLMAYDNNDQAEVKVNLYSRKPGFHYGWDWGPRFVTCGVWRPVRLEAWDRARLDAVQIVQNHVSEKAAELTLVSEIQSNQDGEAAIEIHLGDDLLGKTTALLKEGLNRVPVDVSIADPDLWWPNGLGEQPLYNFQVVLLESGKRVDVRSETTGLRQLRVIREDDGPGKPLTVEVNGVSVFMKGANYIPQDNFQSRVTPERFEHIVKSAADAHMNMLRVWGGGIYEDDRFYDLCDRYGILLWHDFMFACGMYPADEDFLNSVEQEVRDNVRRLRNHPSIALWCGNNENEVSWHAWGWKPKYTEAEQKQYEADYHTLFYELIPNTLKEVDPGRYYQSSSPIAGYLDRGYDSGDIHYWGVWHHKEPFSNFNHHLARFVSEYGFQSYPEPASVRKFTRPEDRRLHSEVMLSHQRCMSDARQDREYGNRLIKAYMDRNYREPRDFDSYLYISQVLQAEGIRAAIEIHRRAMPFCMGSLYWQIDDCWPVASWSSIDYYGRWKALHYAAQKAFSPVILVPFMENDTLTVHGVSDRLEEIRGILSLTLIDFQGRKIREISAGAVVRANTSTLIYCNRLSDVLEGIDPESVLIRMTLDRDEETLAQRIYYVRPVKDLKLPKPELNSRMRKEGDEIILSLRSDVLAKNVWLSTKSGTGFFSDNFFDLLPGEQAEIRFTPESSGFDLEKELIIRTLRDTYR